jgi:hypothetical protein
MITVAVCLATAGTTNGATEVAIFLKKKKGSIGTGRRQSKK